MDEENHIFSYSSGSRFNKEKDEKKENKKEEFSKHKKKNRTKD